MRGLRMNHDAGVTFSTEFIQWSLAHCYLELGDLGKARQSAEQALELATSHHNPFAAGLAKTLLGKILGKADVSQSAEAEVLALEGIKVLDDLKLRPISAIGHLDLVELYADAGQKDKALEALRKAEAEFKDMGMEYGLKKAQEVLARLES